MKFPQYPTTPLPHFPIHNSPISPLPHFPTSPSPYTPHPTPYTLHPTPYTLFQVRSQESGDSKRFCHSRSILSERSLSCSR
ncbi:MULTISPECIES: hypothetical protein [Microcystis]|uniref:hypothetical protein n=1 Tax=Microcystis TaxID=1125 RepID=UPI00178CAFFC|nr:MULTISPECIES: hypothetical protein [Microcystis]MCE2662401.1 hypothetical protein [Microcystis sp. 53602_E8]MCZ8364900.1 hypothetical protein [Microcystis sp. LE19-251.1A]MDJ0530637.1 hypothetical protein [Microcystis sp. M53600_WE12]MDJ0562617.1 hypothetical protein [Microcystis sp. M49629_WE12]MCZ8028151.1 hypothetical protein [Microcystis sp. LE19-10.1B]